MTKSFLIKYKEKHSKEEVDNFDLIAPTLTTSTIIESEMSKAQPFTRKHNRNRSGIVTPVTQSRGNDPVIKFFRRSNKLNADI